MPYSPLTDFHDEQSTSYGTNHNQHIRRIRGFMEDRRRFRKETVNHQATGKFNDRLARFRYTLGLVPFSLIAIVVLIRDRNRPKLKWYPILRRIFTYVFFFLDLPAAFLAGLFHRKRRTAWKLIAHTGDIKNKEADRNALKKEP